MNKIIMTMICIIVVIGAMFTAVMIFKPSENEKPETIVTEVADEEILDECTEEYEEMEKQNMIEANSAEEKISPNCSFTEKNYYKKCGHTTSQYLELPQDLVNETEEQLQEKYLCSRCCQHKHSLYSLDFSKLLKLSLLSKVCHSYF